MLLQKALRELDAEIDRWLRVRNVVASLQSSSWPAGRSLPPSSAAKRDDIATAPQAAAESATMRAVPMSEPEEIAAKPPSARRIEWRPREARTHRAAAPVARALGGSIPVRPVVVAPGSAPRPRAIEQAVSSKPVVTPASEGTLDALLRELSRRPVLGT